MDIIPPPRVRGTGRVERVTRSSVFLFTLRGGLSVVVVYCGNRP